MNNFKEHRILEKIKDGSIIIYPTDTVYGIGCNALIKESVEKIKKIKANENNKSFSIIAPSKEWIYQHTKATPELVEKYLPGKYTLILEKKDPEFLSHVSPSNKIGIRIPSHKIAKLIEKAGVPFLTAPANLSEKNPASSIDEINREIFIEADIVINGGKLPGALSTIVFQDGTEIQRQT
ncbi:MAG: L-threonylcarbamoyladenylate synthase [Candidatus Pacearchaeota archaeon]|nr:L-threonylcarbamoyladenylate synthase [Candidatus Pacearchaeota archaeon]